MTPAVFRNQQDHSRKARVRCRRCAFGSLPFTREHLALAVVILAFAAPGCSNGTDLQPDQDLLDRLNALPGVAARAIPPHHGYAQAFRLDITQPLNHDDPGGPTFTQRAYLSHVGTDAPMVLRPDGYAATEQSLEELAGILRANGLYVTHRFFPGAEPSPVDWTYLDIRQAAADQHRIVTELREIYTGLWVSAGASKSGMAALFHRRFYPDDVAATVAYVSPLWATSGSATI